MPFSSQRSSFPSDSIWLWSMTVVFALVAFYADSVPHGLKVGLATALIVDSIAAYIVLYMYVKNDFMNSPLELFYTTTGSGMLLIVLFAFLGQDLYAALALLVVFRYAYDVYVYVRTPVDESYIHARRYFTIFLQAAALVVGILAFAWIAPDLAHTIRRDEHYLACETDICKFTSQPDLFILFGLFLYPLNAWLTFKWQPHWMRWVPAPKHLEG